MRKVTDYIHYAQIKALSACPSLAMKMDASTKGNILCKWIFNYRVNSELINRLFSASYSNEHVLDTHFLNNKTMMGRFDTICRGELFSD